MNRPFQSFTSLISQPLAVAGILLLAVNDLLLQRYFPGWLTGKLGDFAWFLFAPYLLAAIISLILPARWQNEKLAGGLAYGLALTGFALVKTIPAANQAVIDLAAQAGIMLKLTLDPGDVLAALAGSLISWLTWKKPISHVRLPRKASLALLALSTLVIAADMAAPNPGIRCIQAGDKFLKASDWFSVYVSSDGGLTWQNSALMVEQCNQLVQDNLPHFVTGAQDLRYTANESVERSTDGRKTWQVIYSFKPMTEVDQQYYLLRSTSTNTTIGKTPLDALKDSQTGNVVFAMGHEGALVYTAGGDWILASVGTYSFERGLTVGRVATLLMFPALIAVIFAGLAFSIFGLYLRPRWWKWLLLIPATAVGVLMAFNHPAGFQGGYNFGLYLLLGSGVLTGLLVAISLLEGADHFAPAVRSMVSWAIAIGLVFLIGPVLWVLNILKDYLAASLVAVGLTIGLVWDATEVTMARHKKALSEKQVRK